MKNLTIVIIHDYARVRGGASQVAISSAVGLAKKGYSIIYFASENPNNELRDNQNITTVVTKQGISPEGRFRLIDCLRSLWNFKATKDFQTLLDKLDRDNTILHFHVWHRSLSSTLFRVALKNKFKAVCTLHCYLTACPNGDFFDHSKKRFVN